MLLVQQREMESAVGCSRKSYEQGIRKEEGRSVADLVEAFPS